jgi:CheY-like chemotaxis protein
VATLPDKRRHRILVVDDIPEAAQTFAELIKVCDAEVHFITNPRIALSVASRLRPDLVFLDIGMPFINGWQLAKILRPALPDGARIVALTGYATDEDRMKSLSAGMDDHLVKPVGVATVERILSQLASA